MARKDLADSIVDETKAAQGAKKSKELKGQTAMFTPNGETTHTLDASGVVQTTHDAEHKSFSDEHNLPDAKDLLECDTCGTVVVAGGHTDGEVCGLPSENPSEPACAGKLRAHAVI